jgi:hypothetical protein
MSQHENTWASRANQQNVIHSSVFFKFIGTDEYIQIIFVGFKTDEYKVIFVGLGRAPMNIWNIRFDFDLPHIFGWIE